MSKSRPTTPHPARLLTKVGCVLIPAKGKVPVHRNWTTRAYPAADRTIELCHQKGLNVGARLPASIVVIDIDPRNGGSEGWDDLTMEYGIDESIFPSTITGSGGRHYWARKPEDVPIVPNLKAFKGVDFKSKGGQVIAAGSVHPITGRVYRWDDAAPALDQIPELPGSLLRAITRPAAPASMSGGQLTKEQAEEVLSYLDPLDFGTNDKWEALMMAVHHTTAGDARQEFIDWSIGDPKFADDAEHIGGRWDSLHKEKGGSPLRTIGTLRHYLAEKNALHVLPPDQDGAHDDFDGEDDADLPVPDPEPMLYDMNSANEMLEYAQRRMLDGGAPLYQTGGRVVFPVRSAQAADEDSIRRASGALTIQNVAAPRMQLFMIEHAPFVKRVKPPRGGEAILIKQPATEKLATLCLAAPDRWLFPPLNGIIGTPTLRTDGTLLTEPGYDPQSGLLLIMGDAKFPDIQDSPSRDDAIAALDLLKEPFADFPFIQDGPKGTSASRSVMLSTVLTGLVRRTLPTAPAHGVSAPTPGTGKTLALQTASMIVTGRTVTAMSQGASEEEDEKRIFSVLMQGDQFITIDNVTRPIGGDALCTILTEPTWQNRVLGESRNVSVNTNALITATGNNLTFAGDMTRRALLCRMDAGLENPEGRSFDKDLRTRVPAHRGELVAAGLTILRAFVVAGRPGLSRLKPYGSFEAWSNLVRGALVWLGEPDPCVTRKHIAADDPVKAQLAAFFSAVHEAMENRWFTAGELLKAADSFEEADETLRDILYSVVPKPSVLTLGRYLKAHENKIISGLALRSHYDSRKKTWMYKMIG